MSDNYYKGMLRIVEFVFGPWWTDLLSEYWNRGVDFFLLGGIRPDDVTIEAILKFPPRLSLFVLRGWRFKDFLVNKTLLNYNENPNQTGI